MDDKKIRQPRGRPRHFDLDEALTTGQVLFHEKGYDGVGLSAITEAIGIKSPSFYAAFGSKAAYFQKILERYESLASLIETVIDDEHSVSEVLAHLFVSAARAYGADPVTRGCLVMETLRAANDPEIRAMAQSLVDARSARLRAFVAGTHPAAVDALDDYIRHTLSGLSASARQGWSVERLVRVARAASSGAASLLHSPTS